MDTNWMLVIVLWGGLFVVMLACLIPGLKKTPEQRESDVEIGREMARERRERHHEKEKRKRQEAQDSAPAEGCLESTIKTGCLSVIVMVTIIACIMILIATGE